MKTGGKLLFQTFLPIPTPAAPSYLPLSSFIRISSSSFYCVFCICFSLFPLLFSCILSYFFFFLFLLILFFSLLSLLFIFLSLLLSPYHLFLFFFLPPSPFLLVFLFFFFFLLILFAFLFFLLLFFFFLLSPDYVIVSCFNITILSSIIFFKLIPILTAPHYHNISLSCTSNFLLLLLLLNFSFSSSFLLILLIYHLLYPNLH